MLQTKKILQDLQSCFPRCYTIILITLRLQKLSKSLGRNLEAINSTVWHLCTEGVRGRLRWNYWGHKSSNHSGTAQRGRSLKPKQMKTLLSSVNIANQWEHYCPVKSLSTPVKVSWEKWEEQSKFEKSSAWKMGVMGKHTWEPLG